MLSVKYIQKAYFHRPILKSISFEIQLGEVVGILGKNGAGKTTLLRMISVVVTHNNFANRMALRRR